MPKTTNVTVTCPHEDAETGEVCGASVSFALSYVPGEMYGSDADGNRGMWVSGHFEVDGGDETCAQGHEFTRAQSEALEREAEEIAERCAPTRDDY